MAADEFVASYWPERHVAIHGTRDRFSGLGAIASLGGVRDLLRAWTGLVLVNLPDGHDEHSGIQLGAAEARRLYDNGMVLSFVNAEGQFPELRPWLLQLRADLGMPVSTYARCILYANPKGECVTSHFDANANVVLQLRGRKLWRLAPNAWVQHPVDRFAVNMRAVPRSLMDHARADLASVGPSDFEELVLEPGSLLFVPRGTWHSTESLEDALSLNFTFSQVTWAEFLCNALQRRLSSDAKWRALADGIHSSERDRRLAATRRFEGLLRALLLNLATLDVSDLLHEATYERCYEPLPGVRLSIHGTRVDGEGPDGASFTVETDEACAAILPWIASREEPFSTAEFGAHFPTLDSTAVLEHLVQAGLLRLRA
jgi:50S ribosomal protein L16 3-hydroxylase